MNIAWLCEQCKTQQQFTTNEMYGDTIIHCGICQTEYRIKHETFLNVQKTDQEQGYIEWKNTPRWLNDEVRSRLPGYSYEGKTTKL